MFTKESESYSRAAQIAVDEDTGAISLSYNYTNRSKATIRHRSPIHDGAAHLKDCHGSFAHVRRRILDRPMYDWSDETALFYAPVVGKLS